MARPIAQAGPEVASESGAGPGPARGPVARPDARSAGEAVLLAGLVGLAFALRWPNFLYEPTFNDEAVDVVRAVQIAHGQLQTLVNTSSYIGALHNYLMAGLFLAFGPRIELPRLSMVVLGSLTVVPVYLLAREWGGRLAGALAAALLATNAVHILVNSHLAWSNGMTPLFTTLGLWQLSRAVERRSGPGLAWAGAAFGLAMHTHPATLVILPGCAAYLLWRGRALLRTRWLWIGGGLFALGNLPVALHNLLTGFETFRSAQWKLSERQSAAAGGPGQYLENLWDYGLQLLRTLASSIPARAADLAYLLDPLALLWLALAVAALAVLARRGQPLALLVVASSLFASARFSAISFEPVNTGRYAMPAVAVLEVAIAVLLVLVARGQLGRRPAPRSVGPVVAALLAGVLLVSPLIALATYEDTHPVDNRSLVAALATIEARLEPGETLLLDRELSNRRGPEGVKLGGVIEMLLAIRAVPYRYALLEPDDVRGLLARRPGLLVVLDGASVPRLRGRFGLERLAILNQRTRYNDQPEHAVYRLTALP